MKIGYLGPEGTFSEEAGKLYTGQLKEKGEMIAFSTFHDALYAVDQGKITEAIVPIENSIEGTIGLVPDMLATEVNLKIKAELVMPIYHYLIGPKKNSLKDVTDVISKPEIIDQCKDFLRKNLPKAKLHLAYSSSDAVKQVALFPGGEGRVFAAIGTEQSAKMYELKFLAAKINAKDNMTRFVVLAKEDHRPTGRDKTSIVFSTRKDKPGSLHDILGVFALRNINLTKIESRPAKKALGDYYFFADMAGHRQDKVMAEALLEVKQRSSFLKILGSYPKYGVK